VERIVVSLGGSLLFNKKGIDINYLKKVTKLLNDASANIAVSVGGGAVARMYVEAGRELLASNFDLDEIALQIVKANSRLVASSHEKLVFFEDYDEAYAYFLRNDRTIVLGVGTPGQTSDTTSALFAEQVNADKWINLSNVDAVYDRNPSKYKTARKLKKMTHGQLVKLAEKSDSRGPRENFIIDLLAAKILARSNIEAHFVNGRRLREVKKVLNNEEHGGTVVKN